MIKAIVRNGTIQPVDTLPPDWPEGQALLVEPLESDETGSWCEWVDKAMADISDEDHARLITAVNQHRRQAKEQMRRLGLQ